MSEAEVGRASSEGRGITRRGVFAGAALVGVGAGLDHFFLGGEGKEASVPSEEGLAEYPFHGVHQAGIGTPAQEFLQFAAFDVKGEAAEDIRSLLREWTAAAAVLTTGKLYRSAGDVDGPPLDTGEAIGLGAYGLTLTFGFGPSLFGSAGQSRFGLAGRRPDQLAPLPSFQGESLDPAHSDGDLCVQACAAHPQVAFHAVHVLARLVSDVATLRWMQAGFGRTSSTSRAQSTPRNLMGFKDGTNNIRGEDPEEMDEYVWVGSGDGPRWMEGGTYLAVRRIKLLLDVWDATSLEGQERVIGRRKASGAPLGGRDEFDPVDLAARSGGELTIPTDAHVRLSSPEVNGGQRILRRGYSFSESPEPGSGQIDAGLFFISFQRDPQRQFVPLQRRLAESDALNRHTLHTGSAIFACPPGVMQGGFIGESLLA